jgi:hypothetical protein
MDCRAYMRALLLLLFIAGCTPALPPHQLDVSQELTIRRYYWAGRPQCYAILDKGGLK